LTHGIAAADTPPNERTDQTLQDALEQISSNRMMADVTALSSARFGGRQAGTAEDQGSAAWISEQFTSSGLSLAAINDAHATDASIGVMTASIDVPSIDRNPLLSIGPMSATRPRRMPTDFMPVLDSPSADIHAPIVFVGYGRPDDYAGVDVHECLVLFLRGKADHESRTFSHAEKVQLAKAHGAAGYLTAVGPVLKSYETRRGVTGAPNAFYAQLSAADAIPGAWISTRVAEDIVAPSGTDSTGRLREIQEHLNRLPASQSLRTEQYGVLRWKTQVTDGVLANVLARLPGAGPETVIIGAHRDHFGHTAGLVFPGADDNASGTAVLLEVGRVLAQMRWRPTRSLLFISFSGEERDLRGSRLYRARPVVPMTASTAMINVDHAGVGNGRLTVGVTGIDNTIAAEAGQSAGLADKLDLFGFFPGGDHVPFKEAGVPTVTVVSGGIHPHYHQPSDTPDTIDPQILQAVARYIVALTWHMATKP
jgi:hypothetical protein